MTFKELRASKGFCLGVDLAEATGLNRAAISQFDRGKVPDPRWSSIEALAAALDVTPQVVMRAIRESVKLRRVA